MFRGSVTERIRLWYYNQMEFSLTWFFAGIVISVIGLLFTKYYKPIADNFGWGANSYQKYKLIGIGMTMAGIIIALNLHVYVLDFIANTLFGNIKS